MFAYASEDEHGRHYRSCATEWGWREDENRPPYKRPKAIVQANVKTQLDYQPTLHTERKPAAGIILRGTTRGDKDEPRSHSKHYKATRLPTHLSHGKKNSRWYHLEGNDTRGPRRAREPHHNNPETTPRTWRAEGELFTYASEDEHGRHYRSCATEWGWREDENRPPYKGPKAIVRANVKTQLDYQPTFHTERKPAAGIIWRGTT